MTVPLRVCLLSDGVPGHVNQARGLVRRIAAIQEVDCKEITVPMRLPFLRPLLRLVQNSRRSGAYRLARLIYASWPDLDEAPELIISAGGNTSFVNALLAQQLGSANFFMGSLRGLDAELFSAVFTLQALEHPNGGALKNNIVMPILPSNNDPDAGREEAEVVRQQYPGCVFGAVLLGGDGSGYRYKDRDWEQLAAAMNVLSQEQKVIWLLTTSRRTGRRAEAVLRGLLNPEILAEVVWFADRPRNRNAMFLQAADFVLCGEDSMSMVHEALAADVKVVTLSPKLANPPMRYADKIKRLYADGYLQCCSISALGALQVSAVGNTRSHQQREWRSVIEQSLEPLLERIRQTNDPDTP